MDIPSEFEYKGWRVLFYFQLLVDQKCVKNGIKFLDPTDLLVAYCCFVKVSRSANIERD